jgi:hypothetical protein
VGADGGYATDRRRFFSQWPKSVSQKRRNWMGKDRGAEFPPYRSGGGARADAENCEPKEPPSVDPLEPGKPSSLKRFFAWLVGSLPCWSGSDMWVSQAGFYSGSNKRGET